ncbi:glycosyltransferase family 2 protein [Microbulbifer magnicolonia]|uniref:glycosyltransferase family 2 protein n=1 Tax=Microbulbifer magnicolonia TaxID=3109744 RepID=UPI002B407DAA|nr:glycosyltransferase family 2 protein [Microbulbifer sp. GG15]
MSSSNVSVVIVTHNSIPVLPAALDSIAASYATGLVSECFVVDNASSDGTADWVRARHPWCRLIADGGNLGFGRGCNAGIDRASGTYVLLLNPDATLPSADLRRMVEFLDARPRAGVVAPAIREPEGELQAAGGLLTPMALVKEALGVPAHGDLRTIQPGDPPFQTSWVCGAVALLKREMLEQVGGFDPRFFLYFEETDLWLRARSAGWQVWALGDAVATHENAASAKTTGEKLYAGCIAQHYFESRFYYLCKHFGWPAAALAELAEIGVLMAKAAARALQRRPDNTFRVRIQAPILRAPARGAPQ